MGDVLEIYLIVGIFRPLSDLWAPLLSAEDSLDKAPSLEEPFESVVHGGCEDDGLGVV